MTRIRAVLFDFDLTLADSTAAVAACFSYALKKLDIPPVEPVDVRRTIGLGLGEALTLLTGIDDPDVEVRFRVFFVERADQIMVDQTQLLDGVVSTLDQLLDRGLSLGIVSTKYRYRIEHTLERFGISDRFSALVGGNDVDALKPDPQGVMLGLNRLGVGRHEALFVGDHTVDAEAAARAAVPFIGVLTGSKTREDFQSFPHVAVLSGVSDLPAFLSSPGALESVS